TAVETMAMAAGHWFRTAQGDQGVSPDVYFVAPDHLTQRIAYPDADGKVIIDTTGQWANCCSGRHRTASAARSSLRPACLSGQS
ncbi:hypothetical protein, partial [Streptomyces sp. NPDC017991]|uniref:hypothetical protein n=1 Tax=Streptomyces sp. NPDC017991 TaxID=3365026 RepID=UPI0037873C7E